MNEKEYVVRKGIRISYKRVRFMEISYILV